MNDSYFKENAPNAVSKESAIEYSTPSAPFLRCSEIEENDFLKEIKEKPKNFCGNLINTGLYKFTPEIFETLEKIELSPRGEYELTDAITVLAKKQKVKIMKLKNFWKDLGCSSDIEPLGKFIKENFTK